MKVVIASDHGGFKAKKEVIDQMKDIQFIDVGCFSEDSCNYAEFGLKAAEMVSSKEADFGVLICSSGEGISIAANKVKNVRCGIAYNDEVAALLRQHNNANMVAFGAKFMKVDEIVKRIRIFLSTPFEGGRHEKRVQTIKDYEK